MARKAMLAGGPAFDAYLAVVGLGQIAEDYLARDVLGLRRVARGLAHRRGTRLMVRAVRVLRVAALAARRRTAPERSVQRQQVQLAALADALAMVVAGSSAEQLDRLEVPPDLRKRSAVLAGARQRRSPLRRQIATIPSCFRAFDQEPLDCLRLAEGFSSRWPSRAAPLLVVGVRTSGSYLAPLLAASLRALGYREIVWCTARPGHDLSMEAGRLLADTLARSGRVIVTDDPPSTGGALAAAIRLLEHAGATPDSIVLAVATFTRSGALPSALRDQQAVTLPWGRWAVHERLAPGRIHSALEPLLLGRTIEHSKSTTRLRIARVSRVLQLRASRPAIGCEDAVPRGHASARVRVRLVDEDGRREVEQDVLVTGTGLGHLGRQALTVSTALGAWVPEAYGWNRGLLYREWIPRRRRLGPGGADDAAAARRIVSYALARSRALAVPTDPTLRMAGGDPAWRRVADLLATSFARGGRMARPRLRRLARRILSTETPSVIDGAMYARCWFADEQNRLGVPYKKVAADEHAFSNVSLYSFDALFDVAAASADDELAGRGPGFTAQLRTAWDEASGGASSEARWFLYRWLWLTVRQQVDATTARSDSAPALADRRSLAARAAANERYAGSLARVHQMFYRFAYFADVAPASTGALCALDIDGVVETHRFGFPAITPLGALALRALTCHGLRPILATGRSLGELKERCAAYELSGGVAEYGAVAYDAYTGEVSELLGVDDHAALGKLRVALGSQPDVRVESTFRHSVRAYLLGSSGERRALDPDRVRDALEMAGAGAVLRPIRGDEQTDFVPLATNKASGLIALGEMFGRRAAANDPVRQDYRGEPLLLAVGDTVSDLPMFSLASSAFAPANADGAVRRSGTRISRRAYQRGLADAVRRTIGHAPGACAVCRPPRQASDVRELLAALSAQDRGPWGKVALALAPSLVGGR